MSMKAELEQLAEEGWVNAIRCGQLTIYNYTPQTVFARNWIPLTMAARGLVLDDDGRIVANPWPKFFNLGERPETSIDALPVEVPEVAEKLDGSLVIVFFDPFLKRWRSITRGSWGSRQAACAQALLDRSDLSAYKPDFTYLFELIAPWNRVVVPYAQEEMVLIGLRRTNTGDDAPYWAVALEAKEIGVRSIRLQHIPIAAIRLDDPTVKDTEGFVVRFSTGLRVKLKYAQYLTLHKIVTGLSVKGIWEALSTGTELDKATLPDEFLQWYEQQRALILEGYGKLSAQIEQAWMDTGVRPSRKDYAMHWRKFDGTLKAALFKKLDGKPYDEVIWRQLEPRGHEVYRVPDL